jgi:hypothetical protein
MTTTFPLVAATFNHTTTGFISPAIIPTGRICVEVADVFDLSSCLPSLSIKS